MSFLLAPVSRDPVGEGEGTHPSWGALIGAACLPVLAIYLAAVALLAMLTAAAGASSSLAGAARLGAVGWLLTHHVPLTIDGAPLGVLPLLLTLLGGALVARGAAAIAARHGISQPGSAGWVVGVIAGTHGVLGAVLALVATPVTVTADPALAAVVCALVAGTAAGIGLIRPCGLLPAALRRAPGWVRPGVDAGLWGLAVLLTAGLTTALLALVVSAPEVIQMSGSDAGSIFGLTVLSIGYLPNAAIAGLSWLAGPGFSIGAVSISPFAVHPGPVPAMPLLAALPQDRAQPWLSVVLVVPLLVGAAVGRRCAAAGHDLPQRLRVLSVAATVIAFGSAVFGALAGGRLGAAAFDPVEIPYGLLLVAVLLPTLLSGSAATLLLPAASNPEPPELNSRAVQDAAEDSAVELGADELGADELRAVELGNSSAGGGEEDSGAGDTTTG